LDDIKYKIVNLILKP